MNTEFLSTYCERTLPGFWEEPLNALTNLAFILAGIFALKLYQQQANARFTSHWDIVILIVLLFTIGAGSGLWHVMPTRYTVLADVIPILLFMNVYLLSFLHRLANRRPWQLLLFFLIFQLLNFCIGVSFSAGFLNGSIFYAPAWISLVLMCIYLYVVKHTLRRRFGIAVGVFSLSLCFRTIDQEACQWIPFGTHFIWHLLNALLLYILTGVLMGQLPKRRLAKT